VFIFAALSILLPSVALAQLEVRASGHATKAASTDTDEFAGTIAGAFVTAFAVKPRELRTAQDQARQVGRTLQWVAQVRVGHEVGGGFIAKFLAGVRLTNDQRWKWPVFAEVLAGAARFGGGGGAGMIQPAVGLIFPRPGRFSFFAQIGAPIHIFSGNTEIGVEGAGGIVFALR
jgi:hypothetical protein